MSVETMALSREQVELWREELVREFSAATEHSEGIGRMDAASLVESALSGHTLIVGVVRDGEVCGLAGVELFTSAAGRKIAHVAALSGHDMQSWIGELLGQVNELARSQGAQAVSHVV